MKKPKRPGEWQDFDVDSTEQTSFDLGVDQDEEIIELEDILEIPQEATASSVEISDAHSELDLKDIEFDFESDEDSLLGDDLTGQLSRDEEKVRDTLMNQQMDSTQSTAFEHEVEPSLGFEGEVPPPDVSQPIKIEPEKHAQLETDLSKEDKQEKVSVDDFVSQIEDRLLEALQQMVESRLPDVVRTVLREEIDRLKQELEKEKA